MQEAGAPQELIEQVVAKDTGMPAVQPANLIITRLFFACATQWNHAGMTGTRTGLNYQAVEVRATKVPEYLDLNPEERDLVWEGLQVMESAALKAWQDKQQS